MDELHAWIDKLSAMSPSDIRDLLKEEGVTGQPCNSRKCPLSNFLKRKCGGNVQVSYSYVSQCNCPDHDVHTVTRQETPRGIERFIEAFDRLDYPELLDSTENTL